MKTEIVKYHNDLNKVKLPRFTETEQNILFIILAKLNNKDKLEKTLHNRIRIFDKDIIKHIDFRMESREQFTKIVESLREKFFRASFRQIIETEDEIIDSNFHFFNIMDIHYKKKNIDDGWDDSKIFSYIDLEVNPRFEYLLDELTGKFTVFELAEFISISGKYTKTLYRLLKQYRQTGKMATYAKDWNGFLEVMDIPKDYKICNIEQRILNPAIKELTKPRTLFDQERIPFKNLKYEKIKGAGRGQGGKVIGIVFSFEPEPEVKVEFKEAQQKLEQQEQEQTQNDYFLDREALKKRLDVARYTSIYINGLSYKIEAVEPILYKTGDLVIAVSIRDEEMRATSAQFNSEQEFIDWYESVR